MSFFRRKEKNLIPPVAERDSARSVSPQPSYRSTTSANTYVASRDGDPYKTSTPPPAGGYGSRYNPAGAVGDVYSRGSGKNVEQDRSELFSGYKPDKQGSGRFFSESDAAPRGADNEPPAGQETEEDVEGIKQQLRFTKQESVNSTRNALRLAREAEETARNTLGKLGDQSGVAFSLHQYLSCTEHPFAHQRN